MPGFWFKPIKVRPEVEQSRDKPPTSIPLGKFTFRETTKPPKTGASGV